MRVGHLEHGLHALISEGIVTEKEVDGMTCIDRCRTKTNTDRCPLLYDVDP